MKTRVKILMDKHSIIHEISILFLYLSKREKMRKELKISANYIKDKDELNENKLDDFILFLKLPRPVSAKGLSWSQSWRNFFFSSQQ